MALFYVQTIIALALVQVHISRHALTFRSKIPSVTLARPRCG
ncbi:hypothetical protein [aff. Roholtiella sp. LEGE 12411]|nr:hypothetical protein [aff. Roholtiella sp. LEGE 12411]